MSTSNIISLTERIVKILERTVKELDAILSEVKEESKDSEAYKVNWSKQ